MVRYILEYKDNSEFASHMGLSTDMATMSRNLLSEKHDAYYLYVGHLERY